MFYVYQHVEKDTGLIFYGGEGFPSGLEPWNKGKCGVYKPETLIKMSQADKSYTKTPSFREKISKLVAKELNPFFGKKHQKQTLDAWARNKSSGREFLVINNETLELLYQGYNRCECSKITGIYRQGLQRALDLGKSPIFGNLEVKYVD